LFFGFVEEYIIRDDDGVDVTDELWSKESCNKRGSEEVVGGGGGGGGG